MKKVLLSIIGIVFFCGTAFGGVVNKTIIPSTILNADPTSVTGDWNIQEYDEVGIWISYDETEVGLSISAAITLDASYDGTNFVDIYFYDVAGTGTAQTTETLSADGWYHLAVPKEFLQPGGLVYLRVSIVATNTDADDNLTVIAYLTGAK